MGFFQGTFQDHFTRKTHSAAVSLVPPVPGNLLPASAVWAAPASHWALAKPRPPAVGTGENPNPGACGQEPELQSVSCSAAEPSRIPLVDLLTSHLYYQSHQPRHHFSHSLEKVMARGLHIRCIHSSGCVLVVLET